MGRLIEGFWDCSYCGRKHISGLTQNCPSCGRVRDETTKFYMDGATRYLSQEQQEKVSSGPDWLCGYCGSYNSSDITICKSCGHSRDDEDNDYFKQQKLNARKVSERAERIRAEPVKKAERIRDEPVKRESIKQRPIRQRVKKPNIFPLFLIAALLALFIYLIIPKSTNLVVDNLTWEYIVQIEEEKTFNESDWDLPINGRLQYTSTEIHHYNQVLDHMETKTRQVSYEVLDGYDEVITGYTDNGNGTFTENTTQVPRYRTEYKTETYEEPVYREEPVYATKYYYEIDRWVKTRKVTTTGDDKEPYYGEVILDTKEREGGRIEKYLLICHNSKGKNVSYTITKEEWQKLNIGDSIKAKVNSFGSFELEI